MSRMRMFMRHGRLRLTLLFAAALVAGCEGASPTDIPLDERMPWPTGEPGAHGFDVARLDAAVTRARSLPQIRSLLVVRNGVLVVEEYFNGTRAADLHDVRSVTKSVVSTLAGIAVRRGELRLDDRIADHLGAWSTDLDDAERTIEVRHLLAMSGGWSWDESTAATYNDWVLSADPVAYLLQRPRAASPGATFRYNSASAHLLGRVIENATGRPLQQYAAEHLFAPLGIDHAEWELLADGHANGGSGLDLRPRDLARVGQMWLRDGAGGSVQIVPPGWMTQATSPSFPYWRTAAPLDLQSYGWLFWLSASPGPAAFFAWGHGGQFVWVVPSLDLIIVTTHEWRDSSIPAGDLAKNGLELIVNDVVPSAR